MNEKTAKDQLDKDLEGINNLHSWRGVLRGLKEAVPGLVDGTVGLVMGGIGGIGSKISGEGFSSGYDQWSDIVRKNLSDPIRSAEMAIGGNAIRNKMDRSISNLKDTAESRLGELMSDDGHVSNDWDRYIRGVNRAVGNEEGWALGTEIAASLPAFGAIGKIGKIGKLRNGIRAVQTARKPSALGTVGKAVWPAIAAGTGYLSSQATRDEKDLEYELAKKILASNTGGKSVDMRAAENDRRLRSLREYAQGIIEPGWRRNPYSVYEMETAPRWSDFANR